MKHLSIRSLRGSFFFLLITSTFTLSAQKQEMKFGKVDKDELAMKICALDSAAESVILCDIGQSYFEYNETDGFELFFERFLKIKIFKNEGYHWAELSIPLYTDGPDEEQLVAVKGRTTNLEGNKEVETKLTSSSIFDETLNKYWKVVKISMPAVKEGSVIEIKYTVKSPFFQRVRDWQFQYSIPVLWSEYELRVPEYFKFSKNMTGNISFVINETSSRIRTIAQITKFNTGYQFSPASHIRSTSVDYSENSQRFAATNILGLKEEPYTTTISNYQAKIEYEPYSYKFPGDEEHRFANEWETVIKKLLEDEDFGIQLKRRNLVKDQVSKIKSATVDPLTLATMSLEATRGLIKWNGRYSKYTDENLANAVSSGTGNSADVNLYLVLLMKELGLNAEPVILSTRDNGFIHEYHPEINGFNYVIACVTINGTDILMDATEQYSPGNLLPLRCIGGKGLLVKDPGFRWVDITAAEPTSDFYFGEFNLNPDGRMEGTLTVSSSGYSGVNVRNRYFQEGEQEYSRWLKEKRKVWQVTTIDFSALDTFDKPVKVIYSLASDAVVEDQGSLVNFNSLLNFGEHSNPFKMEKRSYPIEFGAPIKDVYSFSIEIPDGYQVESLPAPKAIILPEKAGSFRFSASVLGNKVLINSMMDLRKIFFLPTEYSQLREFFSILVEKQAEQIVLRKP